MSHFKYFLQDPITARRVLPQGYTWIGNSNNVEQPYYIGNLDINLRDLRCRILLLRQELEYIVNSNLIIPFKNKYLKNAQILSNLPDCILKHRNGFVKQAIPGQDYVDYRELQNGKLCIAPHDINNSSNKFLSISDLTPGDIYHYFEKFDTHIEEYNEYKLEVSVNLGDINNSITNINNNITELTQQINEIENTTIYNVENNITNINNSITNINNDITNINNNITNIHNEIENITQWQTEVNTTLEVITELTTQINAILAVIANLQVLITTIQADIIAINQRLDNVASGDCIAWALGNDLLEIEFN